MTIKFDGLAAVLSFALVGVMLWLLQRNSVSVVAVPDWYGTSVEEEDVPTWDDLT